MIDKRFEHNKNYYLSFVNINRACFCMLNDNIIDQFKVSNTPHMTGWNSSMSIHSIIKQLETLYGKPDTMPLFHKDALFCSLFLATNVGILPDGYQQTNPLPQIPTKQNVSTSREVLPSYFRLPIRIPTLHSLIGHAIGKAQIPWLSCH